MKARTKKALALALSAVMLVAASVMGTMAYLTSNTGVVTNTFTVGNVSFDVDSALDEANVDEYGVKEDETRVTANEYKLIPGHTYVKDPTVHMSSNTENAWLFVKVVNGIEKIEAVGDTTIAAQMAVKGWVVIDAAKGIYAWPTQVTKDQDVVVFDTFKLATDAAVADYANAKITIQAYAVQADNFSSYTDAWATAPLADWTNA